MSFTASVNKCDVNLQWRSGTETDLRSYALEFSTDGVNYKLVRSLDALGDNHRYSCLHKADVKSGFYRIKFVEKGGNEYYSKTISVNFECDATKLIISPNPVHNYATLWIDGLQGTVSGVLYDVEGRVVKRYVFSNGYNRFNTDKLQRAIYTLEVTDSRGSIVRSRLVIDK